MDDIHFASIRQRVSARLTRRSSLGFLAAAGLPLACVAEVAQAGKKKAKKVTLCSNGQTVKKPKKQAKKLQKQGAGKGACRCGNGGHCFVFVTKDAFTGNALSGLEGADASCQERATASGMPGSYKAWLSDNNNSPTNRFTNIAQAGPYVLPATPANGGGPGVGPVVTTSFAVLIDCVGLETCLQAPVNRTEDGQAAPDLLVWTGTSSRGLSQQENCAGWTSTAGQGALGSSNSVISEWTDTDAQSCADSRPIYCFQQAE